MKQYAFDHLNHGTTYRLVICDNILRKTNKSNNQTIATRFWLIVFSSWRVYMDFVYINLCSFIVCHCRGRRRLRCCRLLFGVSIANSFTSFPFIKINLECIIVLICVFFVSFLVYISVFTLFALYLVFASVWRFEK